jgi:hypothetical protein
LGKHAAFIFKAEDGGSILVFCVVMYCLKMEATYTSETLVLLTSPLDVITQRTKIDFFITVRTTYFTE